MCRQAWTTIQISKHSMYIFCTHSYLVDTDGLYLLFIPRCLRRSIALWFSDHKRRPPHHISGLPVPLHWPEGLLSEWKRHRHQDQHWCIWSILMTLRVEPQRDYMQNNPHLALKHNAKSHVRESRFCIRSSYMIGICTTIEILHKSPSRQYTNKYSGGRRRPRPFPATIS